MGGGTVTASAKTLWRKCWLITYPWERRGSTFLPSVDWIAFHSLVKKVGSPVQPLPSSPGIWKRCKVLCSILSLGRVHKWCPVLPTGSAGCHAGSDGWWLVQCLPVGFPHEAEMHSVLGCGTFCLLQEKMVRSLVLLICNFSVSCFRRDDAETWSLERKRGKWRPCSWTRSPWCDVLYKQNERDSLSPQVYGRIWITTAIGVLRAVNAP